MEKQEIKTLIRKYDLRLYQGKLASYYHGNTAKAKAEITPHKEEILAYLLEEKAEQERKLEEDRQIRARRAAAFEAIPGVPEMRKAARQRAERRREFNRVMDSGESVFRHIEAPSDEEIVEMKKAYPVAAFALEAEWRQEETANYELKNIWKDTYNALCDGKDFAEVKAEHERRMNEFTEKHLWD